MFGTPARWSRFPLDVQQFTLGDAHLCVLHRAGTVSCIGGNQFGQLGDGTHTDSPTAFVPVSGLSNIVAIDAGFEHTCAYRSDHTVWCWGANNYGQLAQPTPGGFDCPRRGSPRVCPDYPTPIRIGGLP